MTNICIFEDDGVHDLHPLVSTRAVYDLRLACDTLLGTICRAAGVTRAFLHVREELAAVTVLEHPEWPVNRLPEEGPVWFVNGRYVPFPGDSLIETVRAGSPESETGRVYLQGDTVVAAWFPEARPLDRPVRPLTIESFAAMEVHEVSGLRMIDRLWDLVDLLPITLNAGCSRYVSAGMKKLHLRPLRGTGVVAVHPENIYTGENVTIGPGAILNAEKGAIILDDDAVVEEGAMLRGPLYVGRHAQIKRGARIDTCAIGTYSKVGGEVCNSIVHSYSNKAHEGFLGHSYLGRWCNLGADTNVSNLRNDYRPVSLYNMHRGVFEESGSQFLGIFMGDHSKSGINSMFDTGSIIGVYCNIYGEGYQDRYIPSFSWGTSGSFAPYRIEKALEVADAVMHRRGMRLAAEEEALLRDLASGVVAGASVGVNGEARGHV